MFLAGPLTVSIALAAGGVLGALFGRWIPARVKETLPLIFGIITLALGIFMITGVNSMHAVVLALLIGTVIGELVYAERGLERMIKACMKLSKRGTHNPDDVFIVQFVTLVSVFCFSSMGIIGAISEGITRQPDILLIKAALDLVTGMIFGASMGIRVSFIAIPQFALLSALYLCASLIMPFMTPTVLRDFTACGGVILLGTSLRMCNIRVFPIINMLPAILVVIPLSALWSMLFG